MTQIKNGKSKGKNNPMYGKVTKIKSGFRKDLGHSVRSSWEANFSRILKYMKINYEYEKYTFKLKKGLENFNPAAPGSNLVLLNILFSWFALMDQIQTDDETTFKRS